MSTAERIEVSVVVATRDREHGCRRLVEVLTSQFQDAESCAYEIVLVIDGHAAYPWIVGCAAQVRVLVLPERRGIAQARNAGIEVAHGALVAFLDDDCIPAATWLAALRRLSRTYPEHVAFGGRVIGTDPGNVYSRLREVVYYYETFGSGYTDPLCTEDWLGAPYVNGGNSAYRRDALVAVGGFDPLLPAYSDVELGRRMCLKRRAVLNPAMAIHHDHPGEFRPYIERCLRSGRARALLWACRGYPQDRPAVVLGAIVRNVLWTNLTTRRRRAGSTPVRVVAILLCREVVHGLGFVQELVGILRGRGGVHGRSDGPPRLGTEKDNS